MRAAQLPRSGAHDLELQIRFVQVHRILRRRRKATVGMQRDTTLVDVAHGAFYAADHVVFRFHCSVTVIDAPESEPDVWRKL